MSQLPILPYAGTSGWQGSEASRDRALADDADGATGNRQQIAMWFLIDAKSHGLTWRELGDAQGWHAGQSSGALSNLHKSGLVARLKERRNRCSVYVLAEYVNDRELSPFKDEGKTKHELCKEILAIINLDPEACSDGEVIDKIHKLLIEEGF
jgi:hypothetical protein